MRFDHGRSRAVGPVHKRKQRVAHQSDVRNANGILPGRYYNFRIINMCYWIMS